MSTAPGSLKLVKGGFIVLDKTGAVQRLLAFQYNPETLLRRLDASATIVGSGGVGAVGQAAPAVPTPVPHETVSFTVTFDATDKLQRGDAVAQQSGLHPVIAALELLLYPQPGSLTVWVSGNKRIVPVRVTQLAFNEQEFDATLNPIRVDVSVQLQVLKDADFPPNSKGRTLWDAHYAQLQQFATQIDAATLGTLGLTGV